MNIENYIASGILEEFVLGRLDEDECTTILALAEQHPAIKDELVAIEQSMEVFARAYSVTPPPLLEQEIFAAIRNAETPPLLSASSTVADYKYWLDKYEDPTDYEDMHMEVIGETPEAKMVIAWIKSGEPDHLHTDYTEVFLIAEGSCRATIDGVTSDYGVGDYVEFTIDKNHSYTVTSDSRMKVIACLVNRAA